MRVKWVKERKVIIQTFNDMEIKEMLRVAKKLTFSNLRKRIGNTLAIKENLRIKEITYSYLFL